VGAARKLYLRRHVADKERYSDHNPAEQKQRGCQKFQEDGQAKEKCA
jgi:hypothetical protein